jgi:hypothetical protein
MSSLLYTELALAFLTRNEVRILFCCSETILFLHQIFLKGLHTRMEDWPTIILGKKDRHLSFHFANSN